MKEGISDVALKSLEDMEGGRGGRRGLCPPISCGVKRNSDSSPLTSPTQGQGQKDPPFWVVLLGVGRGDQLWTLQSIQTFMGPRQTRLVE